MKHLRISVKDKIATYVQRDGAIVCGNKGYKIAFTFDEEWADYPTKTARFIWNNKYFDEIFTGNECDVPVLNDTEKVTVGVYAGDLKTTTPAEIPCLISILCGNPEIADGIMKDYRDEVIQAVADAKQAAKEAKETVESFITPSIDVEKIEGGHKVIVKDTDGVESFEVKLDSGGGLTGDQFTQFNEIVEWFKQNVYESMRLVSFSYGTTFEIGTVDATYTLSWEFSKDVSEVTINGNSFEAPPDTSLKKNSKLLEGLTHNPPTPSDKELTYTVKGTRDGGKGESKEATCTIYFKNRYYWGYATDPRASTTDKLPDGFVESLPSNNKGKVDFASSRNISFDITCPDENYIWYAYPKRFGKATMSMSPRGSSMYFNGGFKDPVEVSVTNKAGYTEDYYVYRSTNHGLSQSVKAT